MFNLAQIDLTYAAFLTSFYILFQCIDGRSPLHMTAVHGRFTRAQTLLEHGERVLILACSGVSALRSVNLY
jgi:ankyrin repeat protein